MPLRDADIRTFWWLALGALLLALLYALTPVLMPFFLAAVLGYVGQPLVQWLDRHRLPRTVAVLVVMLLQFALLALLALTVLPLFIKEASQLARQMPAFLEWMNRTLTPWIAAHTGVTLQLDAASVRTMVAETLQGTEGLGGKVLDSVRMGGLGLVGLMANLVLVPVVQFFLMRDWEQMLGRAGHLVPRRWHGQAVQFVREADQALGQYLHGLVIVILVMGVYYTGALWLTGLAFFLPIGIITGLLVFVPYVGAATGFALGSLAALMQFQDWSGVLWVWVVFGLGQAIEGNLVTPKFVGERIGLHPIAVIFALLAFGQLFGFAGLLLALPASAVLLVGLRKLHAAYLASRFYSGGK